jgi:hypothetical protein
MKMATQAKPRWLSSGNNSEKVAPLVVQKRNTRIGIVSGGIDD